MSNYSKGKRREREAQLLLEEEGYITERKPSTKWNSDDFWELFDIISIKPETGEVRLIQVKSNISDFYSSRSLINDWAFKTGIKKISCEVWVKEDYKSWRKGVVVALKDSPCNKHSLAFSDSGCAEAKELELKRCPICGFLIKTGEPI